eukprot:g1945.t1 g1945   contig11:404934-405791(-)
MKPTRIASDMSHFILFLATACLSTINAFQTATHASLPMKIESLPKKEIFQRLGSSAKSKQYKLHNEHEVVCPLTNSHQGVLCTTSSSSTYLPNGFDFDNAENIADNNELVSQAILAGSLAASVRNRDKRSDSLYFLPYVITLVESFMAEEVSYMWQDGLMLSDASNAIFCSIESANGIAETAMQQQGGADMIFNSAGLETNEILVDLSEEDHDVMMYACNTQMDKQCATSDVYLIPRIRDKNSKLWRFTIEYKVATLNLSQIRSFGDRESTTPLIPPVWLKDDCY